MNRTRDGTTGVGRRFDWGQGILKGNPRLQRLLDARPALSSHCSPDALGQISGTVEASQQPSRGPPVFRAGDRGGLTENEGDCAKVL